MLQSHNRLGFLASIDAASIRLHGTVFIVRSEWPIKVLTGGNARLVLGDLGARRNLVVKMSIYVGSRGGLSKFYD
jgi:hypothetical protein